MVGITALDQQQESTKSAIWDHVPLTANGANGEIAAQPAETEIKSELLKFQPNMEEEYVHCTMQGETVMSDRVREV